MRFDQIIRNVTVDGVLSSIGLIRRSEAPGAGTFLFGMGIGLLGGAAAALLLAPYTGGETREKLLRAGEDLGRTVTTKVNELAKMRAGGAEPSILETGGISTGSAYNQGSRLAT